MCQSPHTWWLQTTQYLSVQRSGLQGRLSWVLCSGAPRAVFSSVGWAGGILPLSPARHQQHSCFCGYRTKVLIFLLAVSQGHCPLVEAPVAPCPVGLSQHRGSLLQGSPETVSRAHVSLLTEQNLSGGGCTVSFALFGCLETRHAPACLRGGPCKATTRGGGPLRYVSCTQ